MIARPVRNGDDIDNDTRQGQCHAAGAVGNDSAEHGPWVIGLCRPICVTETTSRWIKHAPHNGKMIYVSLLVTDEFWSPINYCAISTYLWLGAPCSSLKSDEAKVLKTMLYGLTSFSFKI